MPFIQEIAAEVLFFIKDCRVLGLRRGDLLHVACWIRSSSSGCVLRVIGRILSGLLAVKDRDKTQGNSLPYQIARKLDDDFKLEEDDDEEEELTLAEALITAQEYL